MFICIIKLTSKILEIFHMLVFEQCASRRHDNRKVFPPRTVYRRVGKNPGFLPKNPVIWVFCLNNWVFWVLYKKDWVLMVFKGSIYQ